MCNDGVNIANKRTIPGELISETDTAAKRRKIQIEPYSGVDSVSTVVGNEENNSIDTESTKESVTSRESRNDTTAEDQTEKQKGQLKDELNIIEDVDLEVQRITKCNTVAKTIQSNTEGDAAIEGVTNASNNGSVTTEVDTASTNQSVTDVEYDEMQSRKIRKRKLSEELPEDSNEKNTAVRYGK